MVVLYWFVPATRYGCGRITEVRLAFKLLKRKGFKGKAMDYFNEIQGWNFEQEAQRLSEIDEKIIIFLKNIGKSSVQFFKKRRLS